MSASTATRSSTAALVDVARVHGEPIKDGCGAPPKDIINARSSIWVGLDGTGITRRLGEFHPSLTAMATSKGTSGVVVEVGNPSRMLALKAKQCARLEVKIPSGAGGTGADVEIDCDAGEGARVRASLHAASCH